MGGVVGCQRCQLANTGLPNTAPPGSRQRLPSSCQRFTGGITARYRRVIESNRRWRWRRRLPHLNRTQGAARQLAAVTVNVVVRGRPALNNATQCHYSTSLHRKTKTREQLKQETKEVILTPLPK